MHHTDKIKIHQAKIADLKDIKSLLANWLSAGEVEHYLPYIKNSIRGEKTAIEYDNHYFVMVSDKNKTIGVLGYRRPIPKVKKFAHAKNPAELNMFYLAPNWRGQGAGRSGLEYLEDQILMNGYQEILVRSSDRFKDTAWGFYDHHGFRRVGKIEEEDKKCSQIWSKILAVSDKILIDNKKFIPKIGLLPCAIHGAPRVGASLFSVVFCAKLIEQNHKLIFISAYPMARPELLKRLGRKKFIIINRAEDIKKINQQSVIIYSGINSQIVKKIIQQAKINSRSVICLKNLEEYSPAVLKSLAQHKNVVFSGDFSKIKQEEVFFSAKTKIFFSEYDYSIPELKKYEGYMIGKNMKGKIKLAK